MATDATGTPSSLGIPKYNTASNAPSGKGLNAIVDAIDTLLVARIPKTLLTTTGDIMYASDASTPARLAIGSTGQVLTVAAGVPAWAASGAQTVTQICDLTLAAPAATIDTNAILGGVIPATYNHLMLTLYLATSLSATTDYVDMQFNGDTGSNYHGGTQLIQNGSGVSIASASTMIMRVMQIPAATATSRFSALTLFIPHYRNTVGHKTFTGTASTFFNDTAASFETGIPAGLWKNTAALTRILLQPGTGPNFVVGSRFTLYGLT